MAWDDVRERHFSTLSSAPTHSTTLPPYIPMSEFGALPTIMSPADSTLRREPHERVAVRYARAEVVRLASALPTFTFLSFV
jgi:hypothetical protein